MASSKDPIMSINQKLASIEVLSNFLITDTKVPILSVVPMSFPNEPLIS